VHRVWLFNPILPAGAWPELTAMNEYEPDGRGHDDIGPRTTSDQDEASAAVPHDKDHQLPVSRRNGVHRNAQKLADRLIWILEPQLRSDLRRAKRIT
jgi:hypothetical protein